MHKEYHLDMVALETVNLLASNGRWKLDGLLVEDVSNPEKFQELTVIQS